MGDDFLYTLQDPQLGTGHAVMVALPVLPTDIETIFVACGDTPLLSAGTLKAIDGLFSKTKAACTILTANMTNPFGYGRIIRDPLGHIKGIVEERDATEEEKKIAEINTGTYCFRADLLRQAAAELTSNNAQNEYYLTDVIKWFYEQGKLVNSLIAKDNREILGINDRGQLAEVSTILRQRKCQELMQDGVTIINPADTYIDLDVQIGQDSVIEPGDFLARTYRDR